jgi:replicative DNA helicase
VNTLDAEKALIGELVYDHTKVRQAAAIVVPDDFSNVRLGNVFGLIAALVSSGGVVDGPILLGEVQQRSTAVRQDWPDARDLVALIGTGSGAAGAVEGYARQIAEGALRRGVAMEARRIAQDAAEAEDTATLVDDAIHRLEAVRERHSTGDSAGQSLREVLDRCDPADEQYDWVVPDLIERMDRLILTGDEGAGKTTMLRQVAVLAAAGIHPFTWEPMEPVRVTVVDCENSERQWRRQTRGLVTQAWRNGHRDPAAFMHTVFTIDDESLTGRRGSIDLTRSHDLEALHRLLDEHPADLVLIGPLYKLAPRALQTDDEAAPVLAALDSLRAHGTALLTEAHFGNAGSGTSGPRDARPRGSRALVGWPEFGLCLIHSTENPGQACEVIRWRGDREPRPWPTKLWRSGPYPWTPDGVNTNLAAAHRRGVHAGRDWSEVAS